MLDRNDNGPDMNKDWSVGANHGAGPKPETVQLPPGLYGAPFKETVSQVVFFPDKTDVDAFNKKIEGERGHRIAATCMSEDKLWRSEYGGHICGREFIGFLIPLGDTVFYKFAMSAAKEIYKTVGVVKYAMTPKGFDVADVLAVVDLFRKALTYEPPSSEPERDQDDDRDQDDTTPKFSIRSRKIKAIDRWRKDQTAKGKTPPTFTGRTFDGKTIKRTFADHWWYDAIMGERSKEERLTGPEVVVAAVIKSALIGPWTFECWPGPGRAAAFSTMSRMTWRRNRDYLAKRGLVELEHFGNGVAPIIYPIVPGLAYRSVFAPSNKAARKKKRGDDE